jgi:hypothetical protein
VKNVSGALVVTSYCVVSAVGIYEQVCAIISGVISLKDQIVARKREKVTHFQSPRGKEAAVIIKEETLLKEQVIDFDNSPQKEHKKSPKEVKK